MNEVSQRIERPWRKLWEKLEASKLTSPEMFKTVCSQLAIDPEAFEDQTTLEEAMRTSFFQPQDVGPPISIEDLLRETGLQECPMLRREVTVKESPHYLYETPSGVIAFVPVAKEQEGA